MKNPDAISDETVWFDPQEDVDAYRHSKRLAERAAFDFMKSHQSAMTLATVLPGAIFGPILTTDSLGSAEVIRRLLQGRVPANPHAAKAQRLLGWQSRPAATTLVDCAESLISNHAV